ncbi:MAG: XRE family transcriptional regulator [Candidatus Sumerlaeota bacterium]|nr:XRE family transcriptional regulator [Candidatus Sumerlaeota bacterium]
MGKITNELSLIFGSDSKGNSPEERARTSSCIFVRSQGQLALDNPNASGRRLSAWEAYQAFGIKVLQEVIDYGSAILPATRDEPSITIRKRRESLGLSTKDLARAAGVKEQEVKEAEDANTRSPIRILERIAQAMALDEQSITFVPQAGGDKSLAVRLRELSQDKRPFSTRSVAQLCEAAWVIRKQNDIRRWLSHFKRSMARPPQLTPSDNYGEPNYPAWLHGYYLARKAREALGIPPKRPIENLREFIEKRLGISVVWLPLPPTFAGATVANGTARGITVNIAGANKNVWVQRVTLAHELGHLLWDPDQKLEKLKVDSYQEIAEAPWKLDGIEQRANAFAVEFIAPQGEAVRVFSRCKNMSEGLREVMDTFGISYTSAKYHIWNGLNRSIPLDELKVDNIQPTDEWTGRETPTLDYFRPQSVPYSRRGYFACLVTQAANLGLITHETAAAYLKCRPEEFDENMDEIPGYYHFSPQE